MGCVVCEWSADVGEGVCRMCEVCVGYTGVYSVSQNSPPQVLLEPLLSLLPQTYSELTINIEKLQLTLSFC